MPRTDITTRVSLRSVVKCDSVQFVLGGSAIVLSLGFLGSDVSPKYYVLILLSANWMVELLASLFFGAPPIIILLSHFRWTTTLISIGNPKSLRKWLIIRALALFPALSLLMAFGFIRQFPDLRISEAASELVVYGDLSIPLTLIGLCTIAMAFGIVAGIIFVIQAGE